MNNKAFISILVGVILVLAWLTLFGFPQMNFGNYFNSAYAPAISQNSSEQPVPATTTTASTSNALQNISVPPNLLSELRQNASTSAQFPAEATSDIQSLNMSIISPAEGASVSGTVIVVVGAYSNGLNLQWITDGSTTLIEHTTSTAATGIGQDDYYFFAWDTSKESDGLYKILAEAAYSGGPLLDGEATRMVRITGGVPKPALPADQIYWEDAETLINQCQAASLLEVSKDYLGLTDYVTLKDGRTLTLVELINGKSTNPGLTNMRAAVANVSSTCGVVPVTAQRIPQPVP